MALLALLAAGVARGCLRVAGAYCGLLSARTRSASLTGGREAPDVLPARGLWTPPSCSWLTSVTADYRGYLPGSAPSPHRFGGRVYAIPGERK